MLDLTAMARSNATRIDENDFLEKAFNATLRLVK